MSSPKSLSFSSHVIWNTDKLGYMKTGNHEQTLKYGCPPELGGERGRLTPEGLFLSSIAACITSTILHLADRMHVNLSHLETTTQGTVVQKKSQTFEFEKICTMVTIDGDDEYLLERLCSLTPKYCLITNSISSTLQIQYKINGNLSMTYESD